MALPTQLLWTGGPGHEPRVHGGQVRLHLSCNIQHVNEHSWCSHYRSALLLYDGLYAGLWVKARRWEHHRAAVDESIEVAYHTAHGVVQRAAAADSGILLVIAE